MTSRKSKLVECLTMAGHSTEFVANSDLSQALKYASAVEGIVVIDLLSRARTLHTRITELLGAVQSKENPK